MCWYDALKLCAALYNGFLGALPMITFTSEFRNT